MTAASTTKSVQHILEDFVLGTHAVPSQASGAAVPVKGIYVVSYTVDLPSQAANTGTFTETTITASTDAIRVAVGDLFIPFAVSTLNAGLVFGPAAARTIDKAIISNNNVTTGALDAASATVSCLWIKVA